MSDTCKHYGPGASDATRAACPLCKALKTGKMTKTASKVLNAMPVKTKGRICPRCVNEVESLVSRGDEHICEPCAEELDNE